MLGKVEVREDLPKEKILPPNMDFSIVIPKIEASAPVVAAVDPYNEKEFLSALRNGVAHAKGTSYPGSEGNVYIFAHSTDAFYNVGRYNAVFYLIGKLEKGDEIDIYYKGQLYSYEVFDKKVVPPSAIEYLNKVKGEERLTLQTCYPPGTTINRLIVLAGR
jgi:sortase A